MVFKSILSSIDISRTMLGSDLVQASKKLQNAIAKNLIQRTSPLFTFSVNLSTNFNRNTPRYFTGPKEQLILSNKHMRFFDNRIGICSRIKINSFSQSVNITQKQLANMTPSAFNIKCTTPNISQTLLLCLQTHYTALIENLRKSKRRISAVCKKCLPCMLYI